MDKNSKHLAINGGSPVTQKIINIHQPYLDEEDFQIVFETTKTTYISGDGPACRQFETDLAKYLGAKHVLYTSSCTNALDLAFMVKKFPAGSEVIVPNFTFTSTALGPLLNNLKIKLVDVYPDNGNIDVTKIEDAISENTVAIVTIDYAGNPAEMDEVNKIARKYNLYVVHDTAQSIGAEYHGRRTGVFADVSTFSFHATKNITTGEGGAFVTDNDDIAALAKLMREKGTNKHELITKNNKRGFQEYVEIGNSYVQSNINGALGITQLKKIDWINSERAKIAKFYIKELSNLENVNLPKITDNANTNWHIFYILVPSEHKFWIMDALRAEGVYANIHYSPLHKNRFYSHLGKDFEFMNSVRFYDRLLRLPIYPGLTELECEIVVQSVKKVMRVL